MSYLHNVVELDLLPFWFFPCKHHKTDRSLLGVALEFLTLRCNLVNQPRVHVLRRQVSFMKQQIVVESRLISARRE